MAEIKWIKLTVNMFDDEKIKTLEKLPDGDTIISLWLRWYLQSAKDKSYQVKSIGGISISKYLSILANKPISVIERVLKVLVEHDLVELSDDLIKIKRFWLTNQEIRNTAEYKEWRNKVFERDNFTCQKCYLRGGKLNAHHIKSFAKFEKLRFDLSNGITLCYQCHKEVHHGEQQEILLVEVEG